LAARLGLAQGQADRQAEPRSQGVFDIEQAHGRQVGPHHAAGFSDDDVLLPAAVGLHLGDERLKGRAVGAVVAQRYAAGHCPARGGGHLRRQRGLQAPERRSDGRLGKFPLGRNDALRPAQHRRTDSAPLREGADLFLDKGAALLDHQHALEGPQPAR